MKINKKIEENLIKDNENYDVSYDLISHYLTGYMNTKEKNKLKQFEMNYDKMVLSQNKSRKRRNKI